MSDIVKICKVHSFLTADQVYNKKEGKFIRMRCKKCHSESYKTREEIRQKKVIEACDQEIVFTCVNHGGLIKTQLTKTTKTCKLCNRIKHIKWQKQNPEKVKQYQITSRNRADYTIRNRNNLIKRKYNISAEEYDELLKKQNYVCAICKQRETTIEGNSNRLKPLCIDHCHKTGKIRGLLCNRCNPMIGLSLDDIERLQSAIDYLLRHK